MIPIEKIPGSHALFASELEGIQLEKLTMEAGDIERFPLDKDLFAGGPSVRCGCMLSSSDIFSCQSAFWLHLLPWHAETEALSSLPLPEQLLSWD